jgi:uncharacterized protein (DUF1684 family)
MKYISIIVLFTCAFSSNAQENYVDSLRAYQQRYVSKHDVVKGADKKMMKFFPVDNSYRVKTRVERIYEAPWFSMETSGKEKQVYRVYAILHFSLNNKALKLHVYQSQRLMDVKEYADHLFIPFTDLTSGESSYENGRYLDLEIEDLESGEYILDFNNAYNPYCAYVSDRYNCPVPPRENDLAIEIRAGEMKFIKNH